MKNILALFLIIPLCIIWIIGGIFVTGSIYLLSQLDVIDD